VLFQTREVLWPRLLGSVYRTVSDPEKLAAYNKLADPVVRSGRPGRGTRRFDVVEAVPCRFEKRSVSAIGG